MICARSESRPKNMCGERGERGIDLGDISIQLEQRHQETNMAISEGTMGPDGPLRVTYRTCQLIVIGRYWQRAYLESFGEERKPHV